MNALRLFLISAGFLGCSPVAPGTFGTLTGVLLALALRSLGQGAPATLGLIVALYLLGRALAPWAEARYGKDPGCFVLDEVIGFLITVLWTSPPSVYALAAGFLLFRAFDIWKPGPVRALERVGGGDGILLDDVAAGLLALLVMALLRTFFPGEGLWVYNGA